MSTAEKKRGRPRAGTLEPAGTWPSGKPRFRCRVRLADGSKSECFFAPEGMAEPAARGWLAAVQAHEDQDHGFLLKKQNAERAKAAADGTPHNAETADAWFARYVEVKRCGSTYRRIAEVQWAKWIGPVLGKKAVRELTRDDVEDVRDRLDRAIEENKLRPASARGIWGHLTAALKAAYAAKERSLRVHAAPLHVGILPPQRGPSRARQWLYPREWAAFVNHEPTPRPFRRAAAIALYTGLRPGELAALTWADVDLEAGVIHVTKAHEKRTKNSPAVVKATKTEENRSVPILPALRPLLEAMRGDELAPVVETDITHEKTAGWFRNALGAAGVTRSALFESTATTEMVDFRSLRDTFATWGAIEGWPLQVVQRRLGHRASTTTDRYIKAAEAIDAKAIGPTFPGLPMGDLSKELAKRVGTKVKSPGGSRASAVARGRSVR